MPKPGWIILAMTGLISSSVTYPARSITTDVNVSEFYGKEFQELTLKTHHPQSSQFAQRPRRRLGGRGGICIVSPGLLEQENVIWSDRPLFLWESGEDVTPQQLQLADQEGRIVWEQSLTETAQSAVYDGTALQPEQLYQWQLTWSVQGEIKSADYTFWVMETNQRNQITQELQTLTRQLQSLGMSAEEIAHRHADYLIQQPEPLWSDALQILHAVENPSMETTQKIQDWINAACNE